MDQRKAAFPVNLIMAVLRLFVELTCTLVHIVERPAVFRSEPVPPAPVSPSADRGTIPTNARWRPVSPRRCEK